MIDAETPHSNKPEGLLIIDKPVGVTSFDVVARVRRTLHVKKVGHAGTLDPFASGLLLVLVGRQFTRLSDELMVGEKRYRANLFLGAATDSHDLTGKVTAESNVIPSLGQIDATLAHFSGQVWQIPPMFSAKSVAGQRLYHLARKGLDIEREPIKVHMRARLLRYAYPHLEIEVVSGKGAYIRVLAHDVGRILGCGAHLVSLAREKSGFYSLADSFDGKRLFQTSDDDLVKDLLQALRLSIE